MRKLLGALCVAGLVAACGSPSSSSSSPSPTSTPAASPSELPSPSPTPSPTPSPSPVPSPTPPAGFACADTSGGSVADSSVTTVRVGQQAGYDRFVIEFGGGVPSYTVTRQQNATFTRSPKGDQVTLEGSAGVLVVVHSVNNWSTYSGPTAFRPLYPYLRQALQVENFEGYQQWALGIQGSPCLRVAIFTSPNRLVVDIAAI
jgi:hypothetical protein